MKVVTEAEVDLSVGIVAGGAGCITSDGITEVDNLQGVPPTGGEGETMVTP